MLCKLEWKWTAPLPFPLLWGRLFHVWQPFPDSHCLGMIAWFHYAIIHPGVWLFCEFHSAQYFSYIWLPFPLKVSRWLLCLNLIRSVFGLSIIRNRMRHPLERLFFPSSAVNCKTVAKFWHYQRLLSDSLSILYWECKMAHGIFRFLITHDAVLLGVTEVCHVSWFLTWCHHHVS